MKKAKLSATGFLLPVIVALLSPQLSWAQVTYPQRAIRLVVPFAPGGNGDILGRRFADRLGVQLKQTVVVDNRGGAGGTLGSAEVARAKPDGYVLLMGSSSSHAISPLMGNPPYDPLKDFTQIAVVGITTMAVAVHPSIAQSLPELIKRVKANPGKFSYGSCGTGSICHLTGELFKIKGGQLDIVHVPYKSSGQSVQDLVSGQIPIVAGTFSSTVQQHRAGRIRLLAVFDEKRASDEPGIPTAIESGMPDMIASTFNAFMAPAGLPAAVLNQLHQAAAIILGDKVFQEELARLQITPAAVGTPEAATRFLRSELNRWAPVVKAINLSAS